MHTRMRREGSILIFCLILTMVVMGLMASTVMVAHASSDWFEGTIGQCEAMALADAAIELRQKTLIAQIADFSPGDGPIVGRTVLEENDVRRTVWRPS